MIKKILLSMVVVVAMVGISQAAMEEGSKELLFDGTLDFDTAYDTEFSLTTGLGFFVQDNIQAGPIVQISYNDVITHIALGGMAEYNIPLQDYPVVPFLGVGLFWANADLKDGGSQDAAVGSFRGGAKYFMADSWAIAAAMVFDLASEDIYAEDRNGYSDTDWRIELGLRTYF